MTHVIKKTIPKPPIAPRRPFVFYDELAETAEFTEFLASVRASRRGCQKLCAIAHRSAPPVAAGSKSMALLVDTHTDDRKSRAESKATDTLLETHEGIHEF